MDCRNALLLMSPHLDGALTDKEEYTLTEHLAGCDPCAREMTLHWRLSGALREIGRETVEAPPELCSLVMGSLRSEHRTTFQWLPLAWRKSVAAAAAILLLAGGSAGVTAALKMAGGGNMIGLTTPTTTVDVDKGGGVTGAEKSSGGESSPPGGVAENLNATGGTVGTPQGSPVDNTKGSGTDAPDVDGNNASKNTAAPAVGEPLAVALLSSEMKINSTVLTVTVNNLPEARAKAVALAAGAEAATQVFPEQSDGKKVVVIRLTADRDKAYGLVAGLSGVGPLVDRRDDSRDITSVYNETAVQYNNLQSGISATGDADQRRQMETQAGSYKQQLDTWKDEASKQVITLWMEEGK